MKRTLNPVFGCLFGLAGALIAACIFQWAIVHFLYRDLPSYMSAADTHEGLNGTIPAMILGFIVGAASPYVLSPISRRKGR